MQHKMFKRRKLPPLITVAALDTERIVIYPRRLASHTSDAFIQTFSHDKKRHRKYEIPASRYGEIEAWATQRDIKFDGIPRCISILRRGVDVDPFIEENCGSVWETLYAYQKEGVRQIITRFKGRGLLADEMGLGKTRQGVAFLDYYNNIGVRMLILCPSYLRFHWKSVVEEHLGVEASVLRAKKKLDVLKESRINIVSYDMLAGVTLQPYEVVLADESHYIKNHKAKRTKAALPLIKRAQRALLLSGTPALNRPIELFTQLHALRPVWFRTYTAFAYRYCAAKLTNFGLDVRGSSCQEELYFIMRQGIMVRRLKDDMLDLPPKTRESWRLELPSAALKDINRGWREWKRLNEVIHHGASEEAKSEAYFERKALLSQMFRHTCAAKKAAVAKFVKDICEREKIIFLGYHKDMLDAIEQNVDVPYIRIDGSTPAEKRPTLVGKFQNGENIKLAILSIGAAGTGLTLTASSTVVFGELYWVPGALLQAEDRAHRISQESPVVVHYLVGMGTLDERIYPMLTDKLKALDTVVDNTSTRTLEGQKQHHVAEEIDIDLL